MVNGKTKTEATINHAQVLISKLLPQRAHFMCDVLFNSREKRYYLTTEVAEYAEETFVLFFMIILWFLSVN